MPLVFWFEIEYESPEDAWTYDEDGEEDERIDRQEQLYLDLYKLHTSADTTAMGAANFPRIKYFAKDETEAAELRNKAEQLILNAGGVIREVECSA